MLQVSRRIKLSATWTFLRPRAVAGSFSCMRASEMGRLAARRHQAQAENVTWADNLQEKYSAFGAAHRQHFRDSSKSVALATASMASKAKLEARKEIRPYAGARPAMERQLPGQVKCHLPCTLKGPRTLTASHSQLACEEKRFKPPSMRDPGGRSMVVEAGEP
jgi:hypothetical protein